MVAELDIADYTTTVMETMKGLDHGAVQRLIVAMKDVRSRDGAIYVFGNGGSGAASSHFAEDVGKMTIPDLESPKGRYRIMSLTDNSPYLLCLGNDLGFESVFEQQLMNLARPGDLAIGISGSGNSKNVVRAIAAAKRMGMTTAGILGYDGGVLKGMVEIPVHVRSMDMQVCEDLHMHIIHQIVKSLAYG
ncbi:MAG: SIS domain-containing protein [Candidatus Thermoplasmatota archaeon]|nr:SIS domain-containing protein [Candidatus Thermoplasmatota archaeon]